jgi:hypothetical protein
MQLALQQPAAPPPILVLPAARLGDRLVHIITGTGRKPENHHRIVDACGHRREGDAPYSRGVYPLVVCAR